MIQAIGMYVMHLPLYVMIVINYLPMDVVLQEKLTKGLLIATLVLLALMIPVGILNLVVSIVSVFKGGVDPTKTTMIVKLCLIPWYALNFLIGFVFTSIFLNPFMMIAIPVIVSIFVVTTYLLMICTSFADAGYVLHKKAKKEWRLSFAVVIGVFFLFIFCLDVIGAIILYRQSKKHSAQAQAPVPAEQN